MKIVNRNGKEYVFCEWRRKYVRLTPEEWVRQHFLHRLVEQFAYPLSCIAVEMPIKDKRVDAVVYSSTLQPRLLIEFKAESVPLSQQVLDQAIIYNRQLDVPYLLLHNGPQTIAVHITNAHCEYLNYIPTYSNLNQ